MKTGTRMRKLITNAGSIFFYFRNRYVKFIIPLTIQFVINLNIKIYSQEPDTLKVEDILQMSFTDLMNIEVITASKVQQQIKDVSATVQVISADQIKERGYFTLEEALSDLPGFQFRNIVGFNSYVFIRGAPSQNNLILLLVDGVQINELNSGGFYGGGQFNLNDVDQIEVVYGPASALYGTNAISGIINVITKNPEGNHTGYVSLLGGNFNTAMADFSFKDYYEDKDFGYSVSGMYKTTEKADLGGQEGDNNWTDDMENFENDLSISGKIDYKEFKAGIVFQEKGSSNTTSYKSVGEKYLDRNSLWDITFLNGFLKYTNDKSDNWKLHSMLYYRNATVKSNTIDDIVKATDTSLGYQVGFYRPNQLFGFENQFNYKATENLMITGGIIAEIEQLSDGFSVTKSTSQDIAPPEPLKPNQLTNKLFSYFLQVQYQLFDQLSFVGGLRQDFSSYYDEVLTPRLGLVFNENKFSAKLLYEEAFRAPKPWDYNYGLGNHNLNPEEMRSVELSLSYLVKDNLSIGSSICKNLIKDKLTKEVLENGDRWINKDELNTVGFELFTNYSIYNCALFVNYTFTDSYDKDELNIREISRHIANAGITYSYNSNFKINVRANYIGKRNNPTLITATGNYIIDDALLLHGCISYFNLNGFDFQLKINNILDQEYYHPSNMFAGRYRQPQRTVTLKVSYNF
ncbi:MAG: TonB-dependent receptor [Ignavibacteriales bacterium]|nr:MAG: TonB-dependent receptor [Ignavibacteriales bacterium]